MSCLEMMRWNDFRAATEIVNLYYQYSFVNFPDNLVYAFVFSTLLFDTVCVDEVICKNSELKTKVLSSIIQKKESNQ